MQTVLLIVLVLIDGALLLAVLSGRVLIAPNYRVSVLARRERPVVFWAVWALYVVAVQGALLRVLSW